MITQNDTFYKRRERMMTNDCQQCILFHTNELTFYITSIHLVLKNVNWRESIVI